ncbi:10319_t:CDS:2 [Funneliformis geosporum]|nr:10319_t:CDS:2 [Funneliformis geosporum]
MDSEADFKVEVKQEQKKEVSKLKSAPKVSKMKSAKVKVSESEKVSKKSSQKFKEVKKEVDLPEMAESSEVLSSSSGYNGDGWENYREIKGVSDIYSAFDKLKLWIEKRQEVVLRLEELKKTFKDIKEVKDRAGLIELERQKADIKKVYLSMPRFLGLKADAPYLPKERQEKIKALELKKLEIEFSVYKEPISKGKTKALFYITRELRAEYKANKVAPIFGDDILAKEND